MILRFHYSMFNFGFICSFSSLMGNENAKFSYIAHLRRQNTSGIIILRKSWEKRRKKKGKKVSDRLFCCSEVHYKKQSCKGI